MSKSPVNQDDLKIGLRMRRARIENGMTQLQLGRQFSVSGQQIQKLENGQNRISAGMLFKLSNLFSKPMTWFTEDIANNDNNAPIIFKENNKIIRITKQLKDADDFTLSQIIRIIRIITKRNN